MPRVIPLILSCEVPRVKNQRNYPRQLTTPNQRNYPRHLTTPNQRNYPRHLTTQKKMCEDQTTRKTHARSGTETRAVEEKINHCAQIVQCSLLGLPAALCFHSRCSSCGSSFRHHGGTGTVGNLFVCIYFDSRIQTGMEPINMKANILVFSGPRLTPGGFADPVHLRPISSSVWYVLGVTCLGSSDSFVCLLTCGTSRSLNVASAFGRTAAT